MEGVTLVANVVHPEPRDIPTRWNAWDNRWAMLVGTPCYLASAVDGGTAMLGVTNYIPNQVSFIISSSVVYKNRVYQTKGYN